MQKVSKNDDHERGFPQFLKLSIYGDTNEGEGESKDDGGNGDEVDVNGTDEDWWRRVEGVHAYLILTASFLTHLIMYGLMWGVGVYYVIFKHVFHATAVNTSWIGSIISAAFGVTGPLSSLLTERFGCRRVCLAGALLSSLGLFTSSLATNLYHLYLTFGVLTGCGLGLSYIPAVVIITKYFTHRRNLAVGLAVCGVGLGTFLLPPLIRYLWMTYGWRGALVLSSAATLQLCICATLMVPPRSNASSLKEKGSSPPDYHDISGGSIASTTPSLISLPYIFLCINNLLICFGLSIVYVHVAAFASTSLTLDDDRSATLVSIIGISNLAGRLLFGVLAQSPRLSPLNLYQGSFLTVAILTAFAPILPDYGSLAAYCGLFGLLTASLGTLLPPILISFVGLDHMGRAYGYLLIFEAVGSLLGAPAAGWLYDQHLTYRYSFYLAGGVYLLAVLVMSITWLVNTSQPCNIRGRYRRSSGASDSTSQVTPPETPPPEYSSLMGSDQNAHFNI